MTVTVKLFLAPDVWTEKPDVGIHDPTSFVVHGVRGAPSGYRVLSYITRENPQPTVNPGASSRKPETATARNGRDDWKSEAAKRLFRQRTCLRARLLLLPSWWRVVLCESAISYRFDCNQTCSKDGTCFNDVEGQPLIHNVFFVRQPSASHRKAGSQVLNGSLSLPTFIFHA